MIDRMDRGTTFGAMNSNIQDNFVEEQGRERENGLVQTNKPMKANTKETKKMATESINGQTDNALRGNFSTT